MRKNLTMSYTYKFGNGETRSFTVSLDAQTLALIPADASAAPPDWTALDFQKCPTCPLSSTEHPRCPAAVGAATVVEGFRNHVSYEEVDVTVTTEERTYVKKTSLEEGMVALMALHLTTSGCPVLDNLRPIAGLQLPCPTPAEAATQFFFLFLAAKHFGTGMRDVLKDLKDALQVIASFIKRLTAIGAQDAARNSMVIFNNLAYMAIRSIEQNKVPNLERLLARHGGKPCG